MARMRLSGRVALVTGAGGGIGRAIAIALARRGCRLALADRDGVGLTETARLAGAPDGATQVTTYVLDVADTAAVERLAPLVEARHGGLDLLVNNAGIALGGTFREIAAADFDRLMAVNFGGTVAMTRACLPLLLRSSDARLVMISSLFGLIAPPGQTAYCASKFAVRGFAESLRHELAGTNVGVTTVHPGGVATRIARDAVMPAGADPAAAEDGRRRFERALVMPPEAAGEAIVRAVERRRARLVLGRDARAAALLERLLPVSHWPLLARLRGRDKEA